MAIDKAWLENALVRDLSVSEMASFLGCSPSTVRRWLEKHALKSPVGRLRTNGLPKSDGRPGDVITADCPQHGATAFRWIPSGRRFYCKRCAYESVRRRRIKVKCLLVMEDGGKCRRCGYAKSLFALDFHHLNPAIKGFSFSANQLFVSLEKLRAEAKKCIVLCRNCHAEVQWAGAGIGDDMIRAPKETLGLDAMDRLIINYETGEWTMTDRDHARTGSLLGRKVQSVRFSPEENAQFERAAMGAFSKPTADAKWPPPDELRRLVWAVPRSRLAATIGVSDTAIAKRCKKLGIPQPPRGHWMKPENRRH